MGRGGARRRGVSGERRSEKKGRGDLNEQRGEGRGGSPGLHAPPTCITRYRTREGSAAWLHTSTIVVTWQEGGERESRMRSRG